MIQRRTNCVHTIRYHIWRRVLEHCWWVFDFGGSCRHEKEVWDMGVKRRSEFSVVMGFFGSFHQIPNGREFANLRSMQSKQSGNWNMTYILSRTQLAWGSLQHHSHNKASKRSKGSFVSSVLSQIVTASRHTLYRVQAPAQSRISQNLDPTPHHHLHSHSSSNPTFRVG